MLLMLLTDDTDFVNGIKMTRQDPAYRVHAGNLHRFFMRWLFWLPIHDVDCDSLIRRRVLEGIDLRSTSGSICVELVKYAQRAGAGFREVSVHHYARKWGESQFFKPGRILQTYLHLAVIWFELMIVDKIRRNPSAESPRDPSRGVRATDYGGFYRDRPVMITGGLGFIGSNLAWTLVDLGARVLIVDSLIDDYGGNLFNICGLEDRLRVNVADVRQQSTMNYLVRGQDVIFNLAGQVSHIDSMRDPHRPGDQLPRAVVDPRGVPQLQRGGQDRLRRHPAGLRQGREPAGVGIAPRPAG